MLARLVGQRSHLEDQFRLDMVRSAVADVVFLGVISLSTEWTTQTEKQLNPPTARHEVSWECRVVPLHVRGPSRFRM